MLYYQRIIILINDQAGQQVRFTEHQAAGIAVESFTPFFAPLNTRGQSFTHKACIDRSVGIPAQESYPDLRLGTEHPTSQKITTVANHLNNFTRLTLRSVGNSATE